MTNASVTLTGDRRQPTFKEDFLHDHQALIAYTERTLQRLFSEEKLFADLPADVTVDEIKAQIAVAKGQSITIIVDRGALGKLKVVVPHTTTTVLHLKKAIRRDVERSQRRTVPPTTTTTTSSDRKSAHRSEGGISSSSSSSDRRTRRDRRTTHQSKLDQRAARKKSRRRRRDESTDDNDERDHHRTSSSSAAAAAAGGERAARRPKPRSTLPPPPTTSSAAAAVRSSLSATIPRISWRYVWRTYALVCENGVRLTEDAKRISEYALGNKSTLRFVRKSKPSAVV